MWFCHFVILNPSSCSLGLFSPNSFNVLFTSLSEGIIKRLAARQFIDQVSVLYVSHLHILSLCCYCYYLPFWFQRFQKKAHFWSWCISYFCGWLFLPFFFVIFCICGLKPITSVQCWNSTLGNVTDSVYKKTSNVRLKGCSNFENSDRWNKTARVDLIQSTHYFFGSFLFVNTWTHYRCRGVCCRQGNSEQMESWGKCRKTEDILNCVCQ